MCCVVAPTCVLGKTFFRGGRSAPHKRCRLLVVAPYDPLSISVSLSLSLSLSLFHSRVCLRVAGGVVLTWELYEYRRDAQGMNEREYRVRSEGSR
jgi:hypothetical protein